MWNIIAMYKKHRNKSKFQTKTLKNVSNSSFNKDFRDFK